MKNRKLLCTILSILLVISSLAGCSKSNTEQTNNNTVSAEDDTNTETEAEATTAPEKAADTLSGTITINTQAGVGVAEAWEAVAKAYMINHPNVQVVVDLKPTEGYGEWVQNIYNTENPTTDIVNINLAGSAAVGKSINFLEYADSDSPYSDGVWTDQFNYSMQVRDLARGEWTALSLDSVQVLWLYNKQIFEEAGITEPPKTWDELAAACEKVKAAGYQPISMPGDYNSFWSGTMGWLAQIYADQTTRSMVNEYRAQEGDYCYDPDVDGTWSYDPTDPYNDDSWKVNSNAVRAFKAVKEGKYAPDSVGMKTVWTNFAKVFPKYAGGDAFFGTSEGVSLFYQGKAAMMVDGAWRLVNFKNDMEKVASGEDVKSGDTVIDGVKKFDLGTFNMPSMEGEGIEANARTIEVANGFLGAIKKDKEHDALVVDFLMYLSSKEGYSYYLTAGINAEMVPNGPSLVYGVELPEEYRSIFDNLSFIGNCQKGYSCMLARGMAGSAGDITESYRAFYDYSYKYLSGKLTIDQWLAKHKVNVNTYLDKAMTTSGISENDLKNPQTAPTGQ
ncbi:extracellular solute-binding protein [Anaerocolumna sedimenticola]|uniref:Extracellular solute-binding protein n=1 Tax=Anaerocolumna sedimenticola TaxID=2696063 RepID=A0A6P1TRV9_9FIRM|nr:extracellular solute-binding protein [Anaerocolumna sedimenticola]QHQ62979.1 extracellular solute-binding protein [Anaerocolumna sedimenticola]